MYFNILKESGQIVGHSETLVKFNDHCLQVELSNITIHETVIDFGNNQTTIQYSYTPSTVDLAGFKQGATNEVLSTSATVSEVTLSNGLIFDDTEKSLNYLQTKRATSNASEVVYDKYNNSETMTNTQLTTAVSTLASSIMAKDDEVKAKIVQITNAQSITEVQLIAGLLQEKTVKLIVDVDGSQFDDVNQVTDETLNQVVMPISGSLDLSTISWLNAKGVKSINGQETSPQQIIDSNTVHTANVTFSSYNPIVTGEVIADGAPVEAEIVVYY